MSYSNVFGATDTTNLIPAVPAPTAGIRQTSTPGAVAPPMMFTPDMSAAAAGRALSTPPAPHRAAPTEAKRAADAERPTSIVSAECRGYKFVSPYLWVHAIADAGNVVKAGTLVYAARRVRLDPTTQGSDFPESWLAWRNGGAGYTDLVRQSVDNEARITTATRTPAQQDAYLIRKNAFIELQTTRAASGATRDQLIAQKKAFDDREAAMLPALPATSPLLLTAATKCFLIGFKRLGSDVAILYAGAVSTKDVEGFAMLHFLEKLLSTQFAAVPRGPIVYGAARPRGIGGGAVTVGQGVSDIAPRGTYAAYPTLIGSQYSIGEIISSAISAVFHIDSKMFAETTIARSPTLVIPGQQKIRQAVTALGGVAALAGLPEMLATATASLLAEAEAAKEMPPADGDVAVAGVLTRLATMRDSMTSNFGGKIVTLTEAPAALSTAQAAIGAYGTTVQAIEASVQRLVQTEIIAKEAQLPFTGFTPSEKTAAHCLMLQRAEPLIASRRANRIPEAMTILAMAPADFATACANAKGAYEQALSSATATLSDAIARAEAIRKEIALDWYMRSWNGLPVWAWGAGGAALLIGGVVVVRVMRKKKSAAAVTK